MGCAPLSPSYAALPQSRSVAIAGAFGERCELGPDDRRHDRVGLTGEGRKAAIRAGDDALAPDDVGVLAIRWAMSLGCSTKLVVELMQPGIRILSSGSFAPLQILPFMRVARIGRLE